MKIAKFKPTERQKYDYGYLIRLVAFALSMLFFGYLICCII